MPRNITLSIIFTFVLAALFVVNTSAQPTIDGRISPSTEYGSSAYKNYASGSIQGSLWKAEDASYFYFAYVVKRAWNDNVYSSSYSDVGYAGWRAESGYGHTFSNLLSGDIIQFTLKNTSGTVKVKADLDYLFKDGTTYKAGLGTGTNYDGYAYTGGSYIELTKSSLVYNIYNGGWNDWLTKSPPYPELSYPNWVYAMVYEFKVNKSCLGSSTFGTADISCQSDCPYKAGGYLSISISGPIVCQDRGTTGVQYDFSITNSGVQNVTNGKLKLTYDAFMSYNSSSITPNSGTGNTEFNLGTISPGQTKTMWVKVNISDMTNTETISLFGEATGTTAAAIKSKSVSCYVTLKVKEVIETQICNPLPVELVSFTASVVSNAVELKWKTATEVNNHGFEVQRTTGNDPWMPIGFVQGHGTVNTPQNYSFVDKSASKLGQTIRYRLKQIDRDGTTDYSPILDVNFSARKKEIGFLNAYPNPFNPTSVLSFNLPLSSRISIKLYDASGKELSTLIDNAEYSQGQHSVMLEAGNLASGTYFVWLLAGETKSVLQVTLAR